MNSPGESEAVFSHGLVQTFCKDSSRGERPQQLTPTAPPWKCEEIIWSSENVWKQLYRFLGPALCSCVFLVGRGFQKLPSPVNTAAPELSPSTLQTRHYPRTRLTTTSLPDHRTTLWYLQVRLWTSLTCLLDLLFVPCLPTCNEPVVLRITSCSPSTSHTHPALPSSTLLWAVKPLCLAPPVGLFLDPEYFLD